MKLSRDPGDEGEETVFEAIKHVMTPIEQSIDKKNNGQKINFVDGM